MKAAVYYETGGPEVLRYEEVPDPVPGPGEALVRVEAISIEGGDTLNRLGGDIPRAPHIVGYQCAGTVVATGEGVVTRSPGHRVVTVGVDGTHAELRTVAEPFFCGPIPAGLTTEAVRRPGRRGWRPPGEVEIDERRVHGDLSKLLRAVAEVPC